MLIFDTMRFPVKFYSNKKQYLRFITGYFKKLIRLCILLTLNTLLIQLLINSSLIPIIINLFMKNILTFLFFVTFFISNAQDKINFTYDPFTGSQLTRELCLNCPPITGKQAKEIKEIEALINEDLEKFSPEDVISYYPNPVKEELYLKWELIDENFVKSIQVIGINGQVLKTYQNKKEINFQNIAFQDLPAGVYIVSLAYNNGDQKTIKIIKQ